MRELDFCDKETVEKVWVVLYKWDLAVASEMFVG